MMISLVFFTFCAFAQLPVSTDTVQLQQLVNKSEEQVQQLKAILEYQQQDGANLARASQILEKLTDGLDRSIRQYEGTKAYADALVELQKDNDYALTYSDSSRVRSQLPGRQGPKSLAAKNLSERDYESIVKFQKESVKANESDLDQQQKLEQALSVGQAGFVPKIEAQAQLGSWQTNTRVSAQLTELLSTMQAMREELRALRDKDQASDAMTELIKGSEIQNERQRKDKTP